VPDLALRLRLSGEERAMLMALTTVSDKIPDLRVWLAGRPRARALGELWIAEARDGVDRAAQRAAVAAMEQPVFPLQGRDLLAEGVAPGPEVGRLLALLRDWWLEGGAVADRAACLDELRKRLGAADGTRRPEH
jgi:poly(A) polymerase/tRNA nucleotidyltransferase (CCA-adding enzyme)